MAQSWRLETNMPRKFETIEVLPQEPPFSAALVQEFGLRGIHCGSARRIVPGWVNTDLLHFRALDETEVERGRLARLDGHLFYLEFDSRAPYPFEDASFDWAHAEHFVEHLELEQAIAWLTEIRRLLKPGGHVRLSTPDLRRYLEGYLDPDNGFFAEHRGRLRGLRAFRDMDVPDRPGWMVNQIFYMWGHHWIFDFEELRYAAERAGFDPASVTRRSFQEGKVAEVAAMDIAGRNDESVYVELTAS
jgi:predicted SAM-dependent methyltransferase